MNTDDPTSPRPSRRQMCASTGAIVPLLAGIGDIGSLQAQGNRITITGTVTSATDTPPVGKSLTVTPQTGRQETESTRIGPDGEFTVTVARADTYTLSYTNQQANGNYARTQDGFPLVYHFGMKGTDDGQRADPSDTAEPDYEGEFGELVLPEAHSTSIRCVDS